MLDTPFEVAYVIGLIAGSLIRAYYRERKRPVSIPWPDRLLLFIVSLGMFFIPVVYVLTPWLDPVDYSLPAEVGWFGAGVFAFALWLLWRSHADLGRNFSLIMEIREGQTLVTQGVYASIRHPMYAAHLLWALAQALLLQNWIAGPAFLITFIPMYLYRVPREEKMMTEHFGEDYRVYMDRTGRIVPRFWLKAGGK